MVRDHDLPFLYVSTELDDDECAMRAAAQMMGASHADLLRGKVSREHARRSIAGLPITVVGADDIRRDPAHDMPRISEAIERVAQRYGSPPLVCVDYLQNLVAGDVFNVRSGVTVVANQLRALAQLHDCPLLAVSSTGRAFYKPPKDGADDPIAYLGAGKESGDIEFAAVNQVFLDVKSEANDDLYYGARLVVAKARRGTAGMVGARFHGPSGRWEECPDMLEELSAEGRLAKQQEQRDGDAQARVLDGIRDNPDTPWKVLRTRCGVANTVADEMRALLLAAGRIIEERVKGRGGTRFVYRVAGEVAS